MKQINWINLFKITLLQFTILVCYSSGLNAQTQNSDSLQAKPSWWFGVAGGANFNFHEGSTQRINENLMSLAAFNKGTGAGLFLGPTIEYYKENTRLGFMLQAFYDNKNGVFNEVLSACNCPIDFKSNLTYLTIEPSLRFAPFKSNWYLFGGPRFSFIQNKSFVYQQRTNPDYPSQIQSPEIKGEMSSVKEFTTSMQVGMGVDLFLSPKDRRTQFILSPFISFLPYMGQTPRSIETWNITTLRVGTSLKFGIAKAKHSKKTTTVQSTPQKEEKPLPLVFEFAVKSPEKIAQERTFSETFPLRNYVFFNLGSTEIPNRYVLLKKEQVKEFKEDQVELFTPVNMSERSSRQMIVYYNLLNILGDRMVKNPNTKIKLLGSSLSGVADAELMAKSVKMYLVNVFSISESRITTEGLLEPVISSRRTGASQELVLLQEGERRVSIESNSMELLMEFHSGPNAPLKPIAIKQVQKSPVENLVVFTNKGSDLVFNSWSLEIKDSSNTIQKYGPFSQESISIPGSTILGDKNAGWFSIKMIGNSIQGEKVYRDTLVNLVLWTPSINEIATRYSVIYEFDDSKANDMSVNYLKEIVAKKIPQGATVIIHGYTDIIGDANYNKKLSLQRANDVKNILTQALNNSGRTDVKFETLGFGEEVENALFPNQYPEERFYNRSVLIDIIPKK